MTTYDSDSSGAEDNFTETNVLLGYATKDETDDNVSHLGGHPEWLDSKTAPTGALARCKTCNSYLSLLLQLNGDMPGTFPGHERRLYVWSCRKKTCRRKDGSIRAFRAIRVSKEAMARAQTAKAVPVAASESKKQQMNLGESLFGAKPLTGGGANPFSASSGSSVPPNPFASSHTSNPFAATSLLAAKPPQPPTLQLSNLTDSFADKLRISSPPHAIRQPARPHEPWPSESSFPDPYPIYNLDADYETLDAEAPMPPQNVRMQLDVDGEFSNSAKDMKGEYESEIDKTFQKFADRLSQNPEQVLRYEFKGQPLLYSKLDAVGKALGDGRSGNAGMTRCGNCGAERVFEVQLTPHAIMELEAEEEGLEGMEWGTVIVGVCRLDCQPGDVGAGEVGYLEEWAGVQWEQTRK
ncbi:hypothetical protein EJ05DRAFT_435196 [Pseudovirgaria hyperparasitica]|uniref:Programmed cell death protein 2 C-terminal domain-containing protein n=1 Tax=Pseudovirgaria hyperparasitica TaxID=470096 RepID=A0A6A6WDP2_9PEZI|nr:uncharacterized protein EJ05DRAFT_435196 [Pseudovirgaria hyperparasitica]KAF2760833.1 hypothetical protein EJ05DRAFT_435196 [Pseudovirgaria hyperparasitica]